MFSAARGTTGVGTKALQSVLLNMNMHCKEIFQTPLIGGTQNKNPENNDGKGNEWGFRRAEPIPFPDLSLFHLQTPSFPVPHLIPL